MCPNHHKNDTVMSNQKHLRFLFTDSVFMDYQRLVKSTADRRTAVAILKETAGKRSFVSSCIQVF